MRKKADLWNIDAKAQEYLEKGACEKVVNCIASYVRRRHLPEDKSEKYFERILVRGDIKELLERFRPADTGTINPVPCMDAVYGALYGDIIGSRHEGSHISKELAMLDIDTAKENESGLYTMTDDSVLTLATAAVLAEKSRKPRIRSGLYYDYKGDLIRAFAESYMDMGKKYPSAGYGPAFSSWLGMKFIGPYGSNGNGSAMRVSPVGAYGMPYEDTIHAAIASAACTHNHIEGIRGACVEAICIWLACMPENRNANGKEMIFNYMKDKYSMPGENLFRDFTLSEAKDIKIFQVQCQFSVPAAIIAFHESASFEDAIANAMSVGWDTDTNACICGAVVGAFYGVPDEVKELVIKKCDKRQKRILERYEMQMGRNK